MQSNTHRLIHRRPLALAHITSTIVKIERKVKIFELESESEERKKKARSKEYPPTHPQTPTCSPNMASTNLDWKVKVKKGREKVRLK